MLVLSSKNIFVRNYFNVFILFDVSMINNNFLFIVELNIKVN